jgi:hypothetical protein
MSLFARADLMSVAIPATSGGCGAVHTRPVTHGAPAASWELKCPECTSYLRGDRKPKVIRVIPGDKDSGIPSRMEHVADADPHWSSTREGAPLTPDEQHIFKLRSEQGKQQLDMLQTYAALSNVPGLDLKNFAEAKWILDRTIDPLKRPTLNGIVVCADGHENPAGMKFCGECAMPMTIRPAIEPATEPAVEDLYKPENLTLLHVNTLRKKCRDQGLPDAGKKEDLIVRLGGL